MDSRFQALLGAQCPPPSSVPPLPPLPQQVPGRKRRANPSGSRKKDGTAVTVPSSQRSPSPSAAAHPLLSLAMLPDTSGAIGAAGAGPLPLNPLQGVLVGDGREAEGPSSSYLSALIGRMALERPHQAGAPQQVMSRAVRGMAPSVTTIYFHGSVTSSRCLTLCPPGDVDVLRSKTTTTTGNTTSWRAMTTTGMMTHLGGACPFSTQAGRRRTSRVSLSDLFRQLLGVEALLGQG